MLEQVLLFGLLGFERHVGGVDVGDHDEENRGTDEEDKGYRCQEYKGHEDGFHLDVELLGDQSQDFELLEVLEI